MPGPLLGLTESRVVARSPGDSSSGLRCAQEEGVLKSRGVRIHRLLYGATPRLLGETPRGSSERGRTFLESKTLSTNSSANFEQVPRPVWAMDGIKLLTGNTEMTTPPLAQRLPQSWCREKYATTLRMQPNFEDGEGLDIIWGAGGTDRPPD